MKKTKERMETDIEYVENIVRENKQLKTELKEIKAKSDSRQYLKNDIVDIKNNLLKDMAEPNKKRII